MIVYRTEDHPEANGQKAQLGDQQWTFMFLLEDGTKLHLLMGKAARDSFKAMLEQEELDDLVESAVAGN